MGIFRKLSLLTSVTHRTFAFSWLNMWFAIWLAISLSIPFSILARPQAGVLAEPFPGSRTKLRASVAVEEHMLAAQQAQGRKDYAAAEQEYRAVLALAPRFAEAKMNLGLLYQLQNQQPQAMEMFAQALRLKPELTGANFFLGVDYCQLGEGVKAIPYLRAAVRQKPDLADGWSWLATAYEIAGQIPAEVAALREGLRSQPENVDLLYLLGHAYERLGHEQVAAMEKSAPGSSYVEQLLAESYASSGEWADAEMHLQSALAVTPDRAGLHAELGEVLLRAGNSKGAAQEFDTELRLHPQSLAALVGRGEVKLFQGEMDAALDDWSQAIAFDEPRTEMILGIGEAEFAGSSMGLFPEATVAKLTGLRERLQSNQVHSSEARAARLALAFIDAQASSSTNPIQAVPGMAREVPSEIGAASCTERQVRNWLHEGSASSLARCGNEISDARIAADLRLPIAQALYEAGEYDRSLTVLVQLAANRSHSPEAGYWRANDYKKLATAAYLKLFMADSGSYRVHQLNGDMLVARREDERAMEEYRAAITQKPALPNLHYSLGHLLWKHFHVEQARAELTAELAINSRHAGALEDLGATYLFEHQPSKALPYLRQALQLDRDNTDVHRDLGTAYVELADYANAERELKLAALADHDGSVHYKLGKVYQALRRKDEAAHEFERSTQLNTDSHRRAEERAQRLGQVDAAPVQ